MDFIKVYERIRERGMEAEWGTLNNGLPQISVRVLGITFFVVPDHFPGYEKAESDFICLKYTVWKMMVSYTPFLRYRC